MKTLSVLEDRILGMLAGVAIGDALGMPVETMSRENILKLNGGLGVTYYMNPVQMRIDDTKNLATGDTTDDWQLTSAVARSLIEAKGFDIVHQATTHLSELEKSTFGWGKGTMQSLLEIKHGQRMIGEEPLPVQKGKGSGNGVIMKIAPLAAVTAITGEIMTGNIIELGKLTHPDLRARIAPVAVYSFLVLALLGLIDIYLDEGEPLEEVYHDEVIALIKVLEIKYHANLNSVPVLSEYLSKIDMRSIEGLIDTAGVGFTAWQTAAFTLGVYMRHPRDFTSAILEAVNAGGDTDTNTSVVGGLVGATIGFSEIEEEWKHIPVMGEVKQLSRALYAAFL
jgi:ADP-ribosyl-[dinitrogen reductase] hydrolase